MTAYRIKSLLNCQILPNPLAIVMHAGYLEFGNCQMVFLQLFAPQTLLILPEIVALKLRTNSII